MRYDNRFFQLTRQRGYAPARSKVQVCEAVDGHLEIRYRDQVMPWHEIATPLRVVVAAPAATPRVHAPAPAEHPWRQGYKQMGRNVPVWQVADR